MKIKNPIVIGILVGLAIIIGVAACTFLKPEPEPKLYSATYGYYFQESRVGELQLTLANTGAYEFEGDFDIDNILGEIKVSFDGELGDFRGSVPQLTSLGKSYNDSSLPFPTAIDTDIFIDLTTDLTLLLPPERWAAIYAGYSTQFTPMISYGGPAQLNVEMTVIGTEDVMVPSGTYQKCFVVSGTQPDMQLEMTVWLTEQGVVPQAEITMSVRGIGPLTLVMELEHYE